MENSTSILLAKLQETFSHRSKALVIVESGILLSINIVSLIGNLLICLAYYNNYQLRSVTNILIITLAVSDLLMSTIAMPLSDGALFVGKWPSSQLACKIQGFWVHFLAFLSLQIMALTAINRYFRVFKPGWFRNVFTRRKTTLIVVFAGVFTLAFFVGLLLLAKSKMVFHPGKAICVLVFQNLDQSRLFTVVSSLIFVILPAIVITFCYFNVFRAINQHSRGFARRNEAPNAPAKLNAAEIAVTRTVFTIVAVFFITWVPCFIIDLTDTMYSSHLPRQVYMTYTYLAYASSAANPIIYGVMNKTFRNTSYRLICYCWG